MDEVMTSLYAAIESDDDSAVSALLRPDAFVMTAAADGILLSADAVVADIKRWRDGCRLEIVTSTIGTAGANARWVFDQLVVGDVPVRVTALIARDTTWRIAAAYWSIPYATQDEQDSVKAAGQLEPGVELTDQVTIDAHPLADALRAAIADPSLLPGLYSTADAHVTIGSVTDEVFIGNAGRAAWEDFVGHVRAFSLRGPMRGALVQPDTGWLAANIDIGEPATPYRFFYIWHHDRRGWRIVVSHDAVSRDANSGLGPAPARR
jgi:hypothetical protein